MNYRTDKMQKTSALHCTKLIKNNFLLLVYNFVFLTLRSPYNRAYGLCVERTTIVYKCANVYVCMYARRLCRLFVCVCVLRV